MNKSKKEERVKILSNVYLSMLTNLINEDKKNFTMIRHVIKRSTHYKIRSISKLILEHFNDLIPVTREIVIYLVNVLNDKYISTNIESLIRLWESDYQNIPYVNMWLAYLWYFKNISNYTDKIKYNRILSLRDQALLAKSKKDTVWIRTNRDNADILGVWDRRSVLYSSLILPKDERIPWAESITKSGDIIDRSIYYYLTNYK